MFVIAYVQGTEQFPFVCFEDSSEKSSPFSQRLESLMLREMPGKVGRRLGDWRENEEWSPAEAIFSYPWSEEPDLRPAPSPTPPPPLLMVSQSQDLSLGHMWNQPSTLAPFAKASKGPCSILMWTGWKGRGASGLGHWRWVTWVHGNWKRAHLDTNTWTFKGRLETHKFQNHAMSAIFWSHS